MAGSSGENGPVAVLGSGELNVKQFLMPGPLKRIWNQESARKFS